jgi:putative MATE family efflux protein
MKVNMTEGSISRSLLKMALPVMGTSFLQMAYNLIDMIWIGKMGSGAVAAIGSAGFFLWLSFAFISISQVGAQVKIAQSIGGKKLKLAQSYTVNAIQLNVVLAIIYGLVMILFKDSLIGFFRLGDLAVIDMAKKYLVIIGLGMVFNFTNPVFTAIFTGYGDTKTPFYMNAIGLVINMILDPILIFGMMGFPAMGVSGAAIATIIAQGAVTLSFFIYIKRFKTRVSLKGILELPKIKIIRDIAALGIPVGLQSGLFTGLTMIIARIIAHWGPMAIAVQKVGSQVESLSWMTAIGFQVALSAFIGQNYGAGQPKRILKGYKISMIIMGVVGILTSFLFYFGAERIFKIFIQEEESVKNGVEYLKILSYSQLFMCIEILTAGAFNGLGKTKPPFYITTFFNIIRIPLALFLSRDGLLGLNGVWWAITITTLFKGTFMVGWFIRTTKNWSFFTDKKKIIDKQKADLMNV